MRARRPVLALLVLLVAAVVLHRVSKLQAWQLRGDLVHRVETAAPVVALTFDDGPREPDTRQILALLERLDVRATFFVLGENVERHPELVELALARGHQVANHSYSHARLVLRSADLVEREIRWTDDLLRPLGVPAPIRFRAPYGKKLLVLPWVLADLDKTHVTFDVVSTPGDYLSPPPAAIRDSVLARVRPGSIVVLHDGGGPRRATIAATAMIVTALRRRGYRFVTVDELLES